MFYKRAIITIDVPIEDTFNYLTTRYQSAPYQEACKLTRGDLPLITLCNSKENESIEYSVKAKIPLLGLTPCAWHWGYNLSVPSERQTKVEIWYKYGIWVSLFSAGTAGEQAAHEICETASALDALSR